MNEKDLTLNLPIVGNDGMGDRFGYFIEIEVDRKTNKHWVRYGSRKTTDKKEKGIKSVSIYVRALENVRPATPEEISAYEND